MKRWFWSVLLLLICTGWSGRAAAKEKKVNGLYYDILGADCVRLVGGEFPDETYTIPSQVEIDGDTYTVTQIGNRHVLSNIRGKIRINPWGDVVKKIIVPNTVRIIFEGAFQGQESLEEIVLPHSLQGEIGLYAFQECTGLRSIDIPDGITAIGAGAFDGCTALREIRLPQSLDEIKDAAFRRCVALKELEIPASVTKVGDDSFKESGIRELDFSRNRMKLFNLNCLYATNAMYIAFPQGIETFAMWHSTGLAGKTVSLDFETVRMIAEKRGSEEDAYNLLKSIQSLVLRSSIPLQQIDGTGFAALFPNVKTLAVTGPLEEIDDGFFESNYQGPANLETVFLGPSEIRNEAGGEVLRLEGSRIKRIGPDAFRGQSKLQNIYLPDTLEEIGRGAFYGCSSLKSIAFPSSLTHIGSTAFWNCKLSEVTGLNASIKYDLFQGSQMSHPFMGNPFQFEALQKRFSYFALGYICTDLREWQAKKEFETTAQWRQRVTAANRDKRVAALIEQARKAFVEQAEHPTLSITVGNYDADYQTYPLDLGELGQIYMQVPASEAPAFRRNFADAQISPTFGIKNDLFAVVALEVTVNGKTYRNLAPAPDNDKELLAQLPPLSVDFGGRSDPTPASAIPSAAPPASDVDTRIPQTGAVSARTFAVIFANEVYSREARVPFALNDGRIFARYCRETLGIPEQNIRLVENATLNDTRFQLNWLRQVLGAYNGEARAIVYYAGHGIPDEKRQSASLLPVDGYGSDPSTGYALSDLYALLSACPARNITVFLDACFSGAKRESGMLASARGVAIKVRREVPRGNMVVFTAAQGDETAYQYAEKGHGMFTYFLLKKLQESRGEATLGELEDYLVQEVKKASILHNDKMQTPTVIPAEGVSGWQESKLK